MALRGRNNPQITGPALSHELVDEHAKAAVARILPKRKADVAGSFVAFSMGEGGGEGSAATANEVSPLPNETHDAVENIAAPAFPRPHFSAPYSKGKPTQFEGKVKAWITALLA